MSDQVQEVRTQDGTHRGGSVSGIGSVVTWLPSPYLCQQIPKFWSFWCIPHHLREAVLTVYRKCLAWPRRQERMHSQLKASSCASSSSHKWKEEKERRQRVGGRKGEKEMGAGEEGRSKNVFKTMGKGTCMIEREFTPANCLLTSMCGLCLHTHTHKHMHTHTHAHTYIHTYTCMHAPWKNNLKKRKINLCPFAYSWILRLPALLLGKHHDYRK